jgi:hypothetical protein
MHHGASILDRAQGKNLWTPLQFGNPDVVRLLLGIQSGADLEAQSGIHNTARAFHPDLSRLQVCVAMIKDAL